MASGRDSTPRLPTRRPPPAPVDADDTEARAGKLVLRQQQSDETNADATGITEQDSASLAKLSETMTSGPCEGKTSSWERRRDAYREARSTFRGNHARNPELRARDSDFLDLNQDFKADSAPGATRSSPMASPGVVKEESDTKTANSQSKRRNVGAIVENPLVSRTAIRACCRSPGAARPKFFKEVIYILSTHMCEQKGGVGGGRGGCACAEWEGGGCAWAEGGGGG